ncbi:unnamed protein product [Phytophthora fragariaefolia]|uniref:Unnamed protein product n=1 Tax=Phytophthora fragariaefolia TaxID=1490495 RepID=A0A9W6U2P0_9STRA|nr:unnamed protein product [Phytophthora fragariaefolia]
MCLPVVFTRVAHQVDFRRLFLEDGSRDYLAVTALPQTMLHDAGFSFVKLVPSGECTVRPSLGASRDSQAQSDALSLRELLVAEQGSWNLIAEGRSFTVRREDAPFLVLDPGAPEDYQLEEDEDTRMLTDEERDLLRHTVVLRLQLVAQPQLQDESTVYVPVAEYPPATAPAPPVTSVPDEPWVGPQPEEIKERSPLGWTPGGSETSQNDAGLREAHQQISHLQAAMQARDGHEQARLQTYSRFLRDQMVDQEMTRSEQKFHKSTIRGPEIEEARPKEAADAEVAALQLRLLQAQAQSARDTARVREASHHEIATVTREAERVRIEATAAAEAVATRAREEKIRVKRKFEHRETHTRAQLAAERLAAQEAEIQALQAEVVAARNRPRSPSSVSSRDRQGRNRPRRVRSKTPSVVGQVPVYGHHGGMAGARAMHLTLQQAVSQRRNQSMDPAVARCDSPKLATALRQIREGIMPINGVTGGALPASETRFPGDPEDHFEEAQCCGCEGKRGLSLVLGMPSPPEPVPQEPPGPGAPA